MFCIKYTLFLQFNFIDSFTELKKFKEEQKSKTESTEESETESESETEKPKLSAMKKMPEVKLSNKTQHLLEDLLLEGDLMEISMDENQQIWKLLQVN